MRDLEARLVTNNDETFRASRLQRPLAARSNVCRKIEIVRAANHKGSSPAGSMSVGMDVPKDACYVGMSGHTYVWPLLTARN